MAIQLPRYSSRALPVETVIDPAAAAQAAAAPFAAAQQVVASAAELSDTMRKIRDAEDSAAFELAMTEASIEAKAIIQSPDWDQPDIEGRQADEVLREQYDEVKRRATEAIGNLRGPRNREAALQRLELMFKQRDIDFDNEVIKRGIRKASAESRLAFTAAVEAGNFERAEETLVSARATGLIDDEGLQKGRDIIEDAQRSREARAIGETVNDAYSISKEAGDQAYADLVARDFDDPELEKEAMAIAEAARLDWRHKYKDDAQRAELAAAEQFYDFQVQAENGQMSENQPQYLYESGALGEGLNAITRRDRLRKAVAEGQELIAFEDSIADAVNNGRLLADTKVNRDGLDSYWKKHARGLDKEGTERLLTTITRATGLVPETVQTQIATLARSQGSLGDAVDLYLAATDNGQVKAEMDEMPTPVINAAVKIRDKMPKPLAVETAWEAQYQTEAQKEFNQRRWEDDGAKRMKKSRNNVLDDDFGDADKPDDESLFNSVYDIAFRKIFEETGSYEVAQEAANQTVRDQFTVTRINGEDELMRYGLEGPGSEAIGKRIHRQLATIDGLLVEDSSMAKIHTTNNINEDGEMVLRLSVEGLPLMRERTVTQDGEERLLTEVVEFNLPMDEVREYIAAEPERQELRSTLTQIEDDIRWAEDLQKSPYAGFGTKRAQERRAREREQELAGLRSVEAEARESIEQLPDLTF